MRFIENTAQFFSRFSRWNLLFFGISAGAVPVMAFVINLPIFHQALPRLGAFGLAVGLGAIFLRAYFLSQRASLSLGWGTSLASSLLGSASLYLVLSYIPEISSYPYTLTWSEASRYYYASLYFSERIYGIQTPPTVLHPSRYLLQAVPFLLPDSPIWLHRAWQVLLWIVMPTIASVLLARRLKIVPGLQRWLFVAAAYLVWMVGPVYYHLLVPVIIVIWGFHIQFDPLAQKAARSFCAGCLRRFSLGWGQQGELVPCPGIDGISLNLDRRAHRIRRSPP